MVRILLFRPSRRPLDSPRVTAAWMPRVWVRVRGRRFGEFRYPGGGGKLAPGDDHLHHLGGSEVTGEDFAEGFLQLVGLP